MTSVLNTNAQRLPIARKSDSGEHLAVKSIFRTIQGEGPFTGWPAVFIRLAGCNLACWFCDTVYRVNDGEEPWSVADIVATVDTHTLPSTWPLIVITGGEPFRQNLLPLVAILLRNGYIVQIETSGSAWQDLRGWAGHPSLHVVCSPKVPVVRRQLLPIISAYKYVLRAGEVSDDDGLPTGATQVEDDADADNRAVARPHNAWCPVYVVPMDEQDEDANQQNMAACVASSSRYGYRVSLQAHKILGVN